NTPPPDLSERQVQAFRAVSQTLQVMELAWSAMKLGSYHGHPRNRGWMSTFRRWTSGPAFQQFWPFLRAEYSKPFVRFCEDVLNLQRTRVTAVRGHELPVPLRRADLFDELGKQFAQEWAGPFAELELPAAFSEPGLLTGLDTNARLDSAG